MFADRLADRVLERQSVLCVGLDPRPPYPDELTRDLPHGCVGDALAAERLCLAVIGLTADDACAFKPQVAFFEALGAPGAATLERVVDAAAASGALVIADAKRGDIPSTATAYAEAWLGANSRADAVTVNPYLGGDSITPFVDVADAAGRGVYVLVRTSNPGASDLQELELRDGTRVWEHAASLVAAAGADRRGRHGLSAIGAVIGLTQPDALRRAREHLPYAPLLVPGLGAQGGDPGAARPAFAIHPAGAQIVAARSIVEAWRSEPGSWRRAIAAAAAGIRRETWQLTGA